MHYNACMRTTVELSDPIYRRLKSAAVDRGFRGFSPIVEEALSEYFQAELQRGQMQQSIAAARGAWTQQEADDFERERAQAWVTWQISPS